LLSERLASRSCTVCPLELPTFVGKGADWTAGLERTRASYRYIAHDVQSVYGFRCTYPEEAL